MVAISRFMCDKCLRCAWNSAPGGRCLMILGLMKQRDDKDEQGSSGDLLPRHARVYVPPHAVPERPQAATMESRSVRLDPGVDPRQALTRVDQRTRQSRRRVWVGLFVGSALGMVVGFFLWFGDRSLGSARNQTPPVPAPAISPAGRSVDWASLRGVENHGDRGASLVSGWRCRISHSRCP